MPDEPPCTIILFLKLLSSGTFSGTSGTSTFADLYNIILYAVIYSYVIIIPISYLPKDILSTTQIPSMARRFGDMGR